MKVRKIIDPYYGRGVSLEAGEYSMGATLGVCDKLFGLNLTATPPFDTMKLNSGDENTGLVTLELQVSLVWLTIAITFHKTSWGK